MFSFCGALANHLGAGPGQLKRLGRVTRHRALGTIIAAPAGISLGRA